MTTRIRSLMLGASATAVAVVAVMACSSDPAARESFDEPDAGPDGASLPEAAPEAEAPRDAGYERGPFDPADEVVACAAGVPSGSCATQIVAGRNHFCALMNDHTVRCWGDDTDGALGAAGKTDEPKDPPPKPKGDPDAGDGDGGDGKDAGTDAGVTYTRKVAAISGATQLSAAGTTTCARIDDGTVLCWGGNGYGQLGLSTGRPVFDQDAHPDPAPVVLPGPATRIDVGDTSACALLATGALWCWGNDEQAQLARPDVEPAFVLGPAAADLGANVAVKTGPGTSTILALTKTGDVVSWGAAGGKDGLVCGRMSSISPDPIPNRLMALKNVTSLAVSGSLYKGEGGPLGAGLGPLPPGGGNPRHAHACAVSGGEVSCWGQSDRGALCTGFPEAELLPARTVIASKAWAQQVAVGDEITCARMTDGTIQCCGDDTKGRLGTGKVGLFSAFFGHAEAFKGHAVQVATSSRSVCALVQGGTVECWGSNVVGELAQSESDETPHPSPLKVAF